jgi:hypothetical protein
MTRAGGSGQLTLTAAGERQEAVKNQLKKRFLAKNGGFLGIIWLTSECAASTFTHLA